MLPRTYTPFTATTSLKWLNADAEWLSELETTQAFTIAEKVHLVRVALQQQWICDIEDTPINREALNTLGLHIIASSEGFLIVSGNAALGEYVAFRKDSIHTPEVGVLYGFPPSAALAHTGVIEAEQTHPWPKTVARYFLGGVYSADLKEYEYSVFEQQWKHIEQVAPAITKQAEEEYERNSRRYGIHTIDKTNT